MIRMLRSRSFWLGFWDGFTAIKFLWSDNERLRCYFKRTSVRGQ